MQTNTTRRQLLALGTSAAAYAAGAAIVAGGVALANEAKADTLDTAAWDAAMAHHARCVAVSETAERRCDPANEAFEKIAPDLRALDLSGLPCGPYFDRWSAAHQIDLDALEAKWRAGRGIWWQGENFDTQALAAIQRVRDFRTAYKAAEDTTGVIEANEVADTAADAVCSAETVLMGIPAPHVTALRWKLDRVFADCERGHSVQPYKAEYVAQTIADYQRLLGGEVRA